MSAPHAKKFTRGQRRALRKKLQRTRNGKGRRMQHEPLEVRQMLAADVMPQLLGIQPNVGELLLEGDVRGISPRSLTFNFAQSQSQVDQIDPLTLEQGIVITRAGLDGELGTDDDVQIVGPDANFEGFIGIGDQPNQVIVRFGEALPDDIYRIQVTEDLLDREGDSAVPFVRNFELNLAPQVMSVVPQPVSRNETTGELEIARDTIHVYFNDDNLDLALAENPEFYQLSYQVGASNDNLGMENGEVAFYPMEVEYIEALDMAILRFSHPIDELIVGGGEEASVFRLQVGVKGIASKFSQTIDLVGRDAGSSFDTAHDLSQYHGPVQREDGIVEYDESNPQNLFQGDHEFQVTRGANDAALNGVTFTIDDGDGNLLTFELTNDGTVNGSNIPIDLNTAGTTPLELANAIASQINAAPGLQVQVFVVDDPDAIGFSDAQSVRVKLHGTAANRVTMELGEQSTGLIVDRSQSLLIRGEIRNPWEFTIDLPGGSNEPGHRDINVEDHLYGVADPDGQGVTRVTYNFPTTYGKDPTSPTGEPFQNQITAAQIQRAREIFEIYAFYAGIEFVEVPSSVQADLGIITGDVRAVNPSNTSSVGDYDGAFGYLVDEYGELIDENGDPLPIGEDPVAVAIMDLPDHQGAGSDELGASWQLSAFETIGFYLGLGKSYDLPPGTNQGEEHELDFGAGVESLLPGDFDIAHLQHLHRPDSFDIDMYRFEIAETGRLSAEVIAERLADSSLLDAALTLYRQNGDGTRTAIARNDDYFSEDSFLEMTLEPGTYYIGISASGNNVYDPSIEDSGFGGTSEGIYNLQLRFTPNVTETIQDLGSTDQQVSSLVVQTGGEGLEDGQTIQLRSGTDVRVFEICVVDDLGETPVLSDPNNIPVLVLEDAPPSEVVAALVNAINSATSFDVDASAVGNRIDLTNLSGANPIVLDGSLQASGALVASAGDRAGAALDGDLDGTAGGAFNFWFRAEPEVNDATGNEPRTLFVDSHYTGTGPNGSLARPFKTIAAAIAAAKAADRGDVIRVIGLGGVDDDPTTLADNIPYLIGTVDGNVLKDGADIVLPRGVTMMIDEGAILKFATLSSIVVGSTTSGVDRSFTSFQILGIPERFEPTLDANGEIIQDTERQNRRVTLTSYSETTFANDPEGDKIGTLSDTRYPAQIGGWGGIFISNETDVQQGRGSFEERGIFLTSIIGADIRFAGGTAIIDGQQQPLAPIYMEETRPTINFNLLHYNAGAPLSADPNSLEESTYSVIDGAPATYTSDIERVGPDIFGNRIVNNAQNGMLIRIRTQPGSPRQELTVAGRMDDTDIVYIIPEALHINSTPGGPTTDLVKVLKVNSLQAIQAGDTLTITAFDDNGDEVVLVIEFLRGTTTSDPTYYGLDLDALPSQTEEALAVALADAIEEAREEAEDLLGEDVNLDAYAELRIVRITETATAVFSGNSAIGFDSIMTARLDASLVVDPNVVVKFNSGRIEVEIGANFIAEGEAGRPVVFTSLRDDRYGFGGTLDTNNNGSSTVADEGDWSGIYFAHASSGSIDNAVIAYGGGASSVAGQLEYFNPIEIHQADVRLTNSVLEYNADGVAPDGILTTRNGHLANGNAVVFVRGAQPVIVGNNFRYNEATVLNVDLSTLNHELVVDWGRSTGDLNPILGLGDNQGALIRHNTLTDNDLNAMMVRGGTLTTQGVWDDTDIVHAVFEQITSSDFHTYGGIRLESSARQSLVVKLFGDNAGFVATGRQLDIDDRIGGMLHVIGQPGYPVVFTDMRDDSVGAGLDQYGRLVNDTNNDGSLSTPAPGAWAGLLIDQFANDRNVQVVNEAEASNAPGVGTNGTAQTPQDLGRLAPDEYGGDDNRRLGFEVNGFLSNPGDVDVYSFRAIPGTEVWFDIDRSSYFLDPVIELITWNNTVMAGSSNSFDQSGGGLYGEAGLLTVTNLLQKSGFHENDNWSINPRDAGMRIVLPGTGTERTYHIRIRSNSEDLGDPNMTGATAGVYQLNIRLREVDELAGSTIQFADIRYAENGITVLGQPTHSPVLGESAEDVNNNNNTFNNAHALGNLFNSDRAALSVAGHLSELDGSDIDWYEVGLNFDSVDSPVRYASLILDMDYAAGIRANSIVSVFTADGQLVFTSNSSSVNDDQSHPNSPNDGDLTRGSSGTGDPYLGTIMLPAGTPEDPVTYFVAVSSQARVPVQMDQFFRSDATNPLLRLEPINSVHRIVEDHIGWPGLYSTPSKPDHTQIIREENARAFTLGDFVMFMSRDSNVEETQLVAINPFTGALEANIGKFDRHVRDMLMAPDGTLYAYSVDTERPGDDNPDDENSGNILRIDTGTGSAVQIGDDGIITYIQSITDGTKVVVGNHDDSKQEGKANGEGWGYQFEGTTFAYNGGDSHADLLRAYAIGNRGNVGSNDQSEFANILFLMDASDTDGDNRPLLRPEDVVTATHTAANILSNTGHTNAESVGRVDTSVGGGGFITGLGWVGTELYGVSSTGALYRISNGSGSFTAPGGVITPTLLADTAFNFSSLTAGPKNPDGTTDYSDILFALDSSGNVHAFSVDGDEAHEAHVFQGGRSRISTGISSAHGLQFGTLNRNLWHFQNETLHTTDEGHGLTIPVDNSRPVRWLGGTSLYFGNQLDKFDENGSAYGNKTNDNYDFPGDAHGSIISDSFSLHGYDATDLPTLYFNYLLDTDGKDYEYDPVDPEPARDALRVFAAGEDGQWHLLATNNTYKADDIGGDPDFDDEFDRYGYNFDDGFTYYDPDLSDDLSVVSDVAVDEELRANKDKGTEGIQQLFDTSEWRQARVDLSAFAGQENIRLRFDFSTGGSINLGGRNLASNMQDNTEELRFLSGARIDDGQSFTVTDRHTGVTTTFEFNKGQTFTFGSGAQIRDGVTEGDDQFTLTMLPDPEDPGAPVDSATFQYVLNMADVDAGNVGILFNATDTAAEIAQKTAAAIQAVTEMGITPEFGSLTSPTATPNAFNLRGIVDITNADAPEGMRVSGSNGTTFDPDATANYSVIEYSGDASPEEMAQFAQAVMHLEMTPEAALQGHTIFQVHREFLYGTNYAFDVSKMNERSKLGHDGFLEGDDFGYAGLAGSFGINDFDDNAERRGQDNHFQGVFIDDIIIGFAERGEMVTGAENNSTGFIENLDMRRNQTLSGAYQLEIRRSIDYGVGLLDGKLLLDPSWKFDTNDRLIEGYSIRTSAGSNLANGDQITISDGINSVTFEFYDLDSDSEDDTRGFAGSPTRIAYDKANDIYSVGFESDFSESDVARALLAAINDRAGQVSRGLIATTQRDLGVHGQMNTRNANDTNSNRIDLSARSTSDVVIVSYDLVSDDTFADAFDTGLNGADIASGTTQEVAIQGTIGNNSWRDDRLGIADIDVYQFQMEEGQTVRLSLEEFFPGVAELLPGMTDLVNASLKLFFADGSEVLPQAVQVMGQLVLEFTAGQAGTYHAVVAANTAPLISEARVPDPLQAAPETLSVPLAYNAAALPKNDLGRHQRTYEGDYNLTVRLGENVAVDPEATVQLNRRQRIGIEEYSPERYDDPIRGLYPVGTHSVALPSVDVPLGTREVTGDQNRHRDQGQIILSSNYISNSLEFGILVDGGSRSTATDGSSDDNRPHQGAPRNFGAQLNQARLATGVTITNNVIYDGGLGGIRYSGDDLSGSNPEGAVPFGRIINNTLYGKADGDVGIQVDDFAGPTLMNNIVANFETGLDIDSSSSVSTVVDNTLFHKNLNDSLTTVGTQPIFVGAAEPLFVNAGGKNFYLAAGSKAIDAARDEIQERSDVSTVVNPLGIDSTPLLAPDRDITGQVRGFADGGVGSGGFRDVGAFDRVDSTRPTAKFVEPEDNDEAGEDLDRTNDFIQLASGPLTVFEIQLLDRGEVTGQSEGAGIDDSTVTADSVRLEIVGQDEPLVEGLHYHFQYDATNNVIRLVPAAGLFNEDTLYKITLDSNPDTDDAVIRDLADNPIAFTRQVENEEGIQVGETSFYIQAGGLYDYGDAPDSYGTKLDSDGARHELGSGYYLGSKVDADLDGTPSSDASADNGDDGVFIQPTDLNDLEGSSQWTLQGVARNEIYIKASAPEGAQSFGFVDAWVDFNNNGVFEDSEQILTTYALNEDAIGSGPGQLIVLNNLPVTDFEGTTFARFRYSSTGNLDPTGAAADGEVEDYQVTILSAGVNPWHNAALPEAVTKGDSFVTGKDLNLLIRELSDRNFTYGKGEATPPGKGTGDFRDGYAPHEIDPADVVAYFDVDNDMRITTLDLLLVRNYLLGSVEAEPLEGGSVADAMLANSPVTDVSTPIEVEDYTITEASPPINTSPVPASVVVTPPGSSAIIAETSSFDAIAPSYSDLHMKSAVELMGFARFLDRASSQVDVSFIDEAISLDEIGSQEHLEQLIGSVADEWSANWEGFSFEDEPEDSADDLDELLALLTDSNE